MKKLISTLCVLSLMQAAVNPLISSAETDKNSNGISFVMESEVSNPDLNALASSLGADTDYFNFPNYNVLAPEKDILTAFKKNITQNEALLFINTDAPNKLKNAGGCNGFSILQILTHNGVIPVSAIQEGAEVLHDIQFDKSVNDIIAYYQISQQYLRQHFTMSYAHCNNTTEQQLSKLIDTAEKAMENNKYFYIAFNMSYGSHAIVGIGAADGKWTFNDKTYNKCILTLDSNSIKQDGSAGGFNTNACIYINTENNTYCIPGYEADETNMTFHSVIDNDNLLNYKGLINPTADEDAPSIDNISLVTIRNSSKSREFNFTMINEDKSNTYSGTYDDFRITPHAFFEGNLTTKKFYLDSADCYKFETVKISEEDFDSACGISVHTETSLQNISAFGDFSAEIKDNFLSLTCKSNAEDTGFVISLSSENGLYKNSRFCNYEVWGECQGNISLEETTDGIIVRHDAPLDAKITFLGTQPDEDGNLVYLPQGDEINQIGYEIYSVADNLWKYDEKSNDLVCYVDSNNDGVFDKEVVVGDVNCDGRIDASDASKILAIYAELSTNNKIAPHIIMKRYADWDGDGSIDASDASSVLKRYAELSTT